MELAFFKRDYIEFLCPFCHWGQEESKKTALFLPSSPLCVDLEMARRDLSTNQKVVPHQTLSLLLPSSWTSQLPELWEMHSIVFKTPGFPGDTSGKESTCQCRRHKRCGFDPWVRKIPRSRRCPVEGHGNPLQYSCLENAIYRGAWWATVHGVSESDTTEETEHTHTGWWWRAL